MSRYLVNIQYQPRTVDQPFRAKVTAELKSRSGNYKKGDGPRTAERGSKRDI
jgi:hypothetical protein